MKKANLFKLFIALAVIWLFSLPLPSQIHFSKSEDYGYKIKQLRKSYHLSIDELSKFTGLDKAYLEGIESGKYPLGTSECKRLDEYFGQNLTAL